MRPALATFVLFAGCRCGSPPAASHLDGFALVVDLAAQGDVRGAKDAARALSPGDDMERLAGALALVQAATDAAEAADGAAEAAAACGACHRGAGPPRPAFDHRGGAQWIAWGLAWNGPLDPPAPPDAESAAVAAAMDVDPGGTKVARAAAGIAACAACHRRD